MRVQAWRLSWWVILGGCVAACAAWSQEKRKDAPTAPTADDFPALHAEWAQVVKDLRKAQVDFRFAADKDRPALSARFKEKSGQARSMFPRLIAAAEAAFKANPDDAELRELLPALGGVAASLNDDYELALRLCESVIEHSSDERPAPVAAYVFAANAAIEIKPPKFDLLAEKYFTQAAKLSRQQLSLKTLRDRLAKEKADWAVESAIREAEEKAAAADPQKSLPRVLLKIADAYGVAKGDIVLELFENEAPNTVANFIYLVEKGFYDKLTFHRVLPNFVIQGGCPKGDGTGGPPGNYRVPCECYEMKDGKPIFRRHFRGSLSMANTGKRDTGGSQFFLCLSRNDQVQGLDAKFTKDNKPDGGHTVFGRVVTGFDVLAKIQRRNPERPQDQDVRPDRIEKATVIANTKRNHPYVPKKVGDAEVKIDKKPEKKSDEKKSDEKKSDEKKSENVKKGDNEKKTLSGRER